MSDASVAQCARECMTTNALSEEEGKIRRSRGPKTSETCVRCSVSFMFLPHLVGKAYERENLCDMSKNIGWDIIFSAEQIHNETDVLAKQRKSAQNPQENIDRISSRPRAIFNNHANLNVQ